MKQRSSQLRYKAIFAECKGQDPIYEATAVRCSINNQLYILDQVPTNIKIEQEHRGHQQFSIYFFLHIELRWSPSTNKYKSKDIVQCFFLLIFELHVMRGLYGSQNMLMVYYFLSSIIQKQLQRMFTSFLSFFGGKKIEDEEQFIRLTYRKNIKKLLPSTYYNSDSGWGCMLRVAQMAIANILLKKQQANIATIYPLFWDNSEMPFSLQTMTQISQSLYPNKKPYEWYSPCQVGFIMKQSMEKFNLAFSVHICNDNSIFFQEIPSDRQSIILIVMSRIGLDKPQKEYLECLVEIMSLKFFFAILGGTPKYAHLFLKHIDGYLGFLDPHQTKPCQEDLQQALSSAKDNMGKLQWIKKEKICTSMGIMFYFKRQDINQFRQQMLQLKTAFQQKFFLYVDEKRPQLGSQQGIFEIVDLDEVLS